MREMPLFDKVEVDLKQSDSTLVSSKTNSRLYTIQANLTLELKQGFATHYVSSGHWSTHDLLDYIIRKNDEPAIVHGATWSASEDAIRKLVMLGEEGLITQINMLFDWRVKVRRPEALAFSKMAFAKVKTSSCHAKVFLISSESWKISIITSANLTNNPRIEAGVIDTNVEAYNFHRDWLDREMRGAYPFDEERRR